MGSKPKAFLLHGFLGAGKTTFARHLEKEKSALRFTHDEWMSELYGNDPPETHFAEYAERVSSVMEDLWTRCLSIGTSIILDFGFWSRADRAATFDLVQKYGGDPILYRLNCEENVAWARVKERNSQPTGNLYIAKNTFEILKARFEPLDNDEMRIEVGPPSDT